MNRKNDFVIEKIIENKKDNLLTRAFKIGDWFYQINYLGKVIFKTKENLVQFLDNWNEKYLIFKRGSCFIVTTLWGKKLFRKKCLELLYFGEDLFKFRTDKGWGLIINGFVALKPKYQDLKPFRFIHGSRRTILAKLDGKLGIIDIEEKIIIPFCYDEIIYANRCNYIDYIIVKKNNKYGVIDDKFQTVLPIKYSEIKTIEYTNYFIVQDFDNDKKYIIDDKQNIILDNNYKNIVDLKTLFSAGSYFVQNDENKWGLITKSNKTVFDYKYNSIDTFNLVNSNEPSTAYRVQNDKGLYGLIYENENIILPFEFDYIEKTQCGNNTLVVSKNNKYGVVDLKNNTVIDFKYKNLISINHYGDRFLAQNDNNDWTIINNKDEIIDIDLDKIPEVKPYNDKTTYPTKIKSDFILDGYSNSWSNKIMGLRKDDYTYIINAKAELLFKTKCLLYKTYDNYLIFKNGDNKKFVADYNGNILIKPKYQDIEYLYFNDYFKYCENGKWGLIKANEYAEKPKNRHVFDDFPHTNDGVRKSDGKRDSFPSDLMPYHGDCEKNFNFSASSDGKILIEAKYDDIRSCDNEYFSVELNSKTGLIDEFDNVILPFEYDKDFNFIDDNKIIAGKDNKEGVINLKNETLIPFVYDFIYTPSSDTNKNYLEASIDDKYGIIDLNNNVILPFEFAKLSIVSDERVYGNKEYMDCINYLYDFKGNKVCETSFDWFYSLENSDYYIVSHRHENEYGLCDKFGNPIIDFKYKEFRGYYSNNKKQYYFIAKNNLGAYGIVDINDNIVVPFIYDNLHSINIDNGIIAEINRNYYLIDLDNNFIADFKFGTLDTFSSDGYTIVRSNEHGSKWGLINAKGETVKFDLSDVKELKL